MSSKEAENTPASGRGPQREETSVGLSGAPATNGRATLRWAALSEGSERAGYLRVHPVKQKCKILTESIKHYYLIIGEALIYRRPGVCFYGGPRSGKSTASELIHDMLVEEFPYIAFAIVTAQFHEKPTERVIWGDLLGAFHILHSGTAEARKQAVRSAIIAACAARRATHFCLLIDEMQNWNEKELTWLRDLTNLLELQDRLNWTTVGWGDRKLLELSNAMRSKRQDLWGRFLKMPTAFQGIRSVEDLRFYFEEHDKPIRCEFPAGSGVCYSEFFLPQAFGSDWRLAKETENAWAAFERAAAKVGKRVDGLGMEWVAPAVREFLEANVSADCPSFSSTPDDWEQAIATAKYAESLMGDRP